MKTSFHLQNRHLFFFLLFVTAHLLLVDVLTEFKVYPFNYRIMAGIMEAPGQNIWLTPCSVFAAPDLNAQPDGLLSETISQAFYGEYRYTVYRQHMDWMEALPKDERLEKLFYIRFVGSRLDDTQYLAKNPAYPYNIVLVQLLNHGTYNPDSALVIRLAVILIPLLTGVLVFILSARLANRSLRGLARLKALLPALGLALLACLDVLWIVRLVNPGCG